jgi:tetratricopeptide (TPR) repeat protein
MLKKSTLFLFISLLLNANQSFADYPQTDRDFSLLPPFCKAKLKPSSPAETDLWAKRLGHDFGHTHHYCAALHSLRVANNIQPINAERKQAKIGLYGSVLGEVEYMEKNANPQYVLFPNIYTTKAEALFALDRPGEAAAYLTKAIEKNKKFTKAYSMLADYYIKTGNAKAATDILQEGLNHSPKSKKLQKKLNALLK